MNAIDDQSKSLTTYLDIAPGLRAWIRKRGFPKPRYANPNTPPWRPSEVEDWFEILPTHRLDVIASDNG